MARLVIRTATALLLVVVALALFAAQESSAAVYKVGDSAGWTTIGNINYKQWSATKTFRVGDIINFVYSSQFHNVMRVTHAMYRACNTSAPMATYTTGNDSITIATKGHHFFFCGVPGHCQAGQKVDINVLRTTAAQMAPGPSGSPALPSPPSVPAAKAPVSASSGHTAPPAPRSVNSILGFAVLVIAASVFNASVK